MSHSEKAFTKAGKRTVIKHYSQEPFTAHSLRILSLGLSENTDKNIFLSTKSKFFYIRVYIPRIYFQQIFQEKFMRKKV